MTGLAAAVVTLFVAWNPFVTTAAPEGDAADRTTGMVIGAVVIAIVAGATDAILSLLAVSAPTLRTAAGAVIGLFGARWAVGPGPKPSEPGHARLDAIIATLTPPVAIAALAVTAEDGWLAALSGIALALAAGVVMDRRRPPRGVHHALRRATGAAAVAVGVALIFAGIRSV